MVKHGYRQTEIGPLPESWDTIAFGECLSFLPNNTLSRAELNYNDGEIRNIHYGDILVKFPAVLDCEKEILPYINAEIAAKVSKGYLRNGDLILADTAEDVIVGKAVEVIGIGESKVVSGLHTIPCRPKDAEMFAPKWLGYFINHSMYHDQLIPYITGIKVSSVSKNVISGTIIAVPKREEQAEIASVLSDMDILIEDLEKLIAKKKAIKQGAMQELLTGKRRLPGFCDLWREYRVGDIGVFYSGLNGKCKADFGVGGARYITFMNILENTMIDINKLEKVRVLENELQNAVEKDDLFFNTSSETPQEVGMCATLTKDLKNTYLNSFCFGLRLTEPEMYPLFLSYYFNSQEGRKMMSVLAQGATRYNLSKAHFSDAIISVPIKKEQVAIASILSDMEEEIEQLHTKLCKYKNIRSGMMDELLSGRIRLIDKEDV